MPGVAVSRPRLLARHTQWKPAHRLVPSRFPPIGLFDRVAAPEDLQAVFAIEALTNDRLRDEAGEIELVAKEDRVSGPGTTPIMAAFTHLNPEGSRFSDGSYGVYYCAQTVDTALSEVRYHQQRFLLQTRQGPLRIELRLYLADLVPNGASGTDVELCCRARVWDAGAHHGARTHRVAVARHRGDLRGFPGEALAR